MPSGQPRLTTCPVLCVALHGLVVCEATSGLGRGAPGSQEWAEKEVESGGQSWLSSHGVDRRTGTGRASATADVHQLFLGTVHHTPSASQSPHTTTPMGFT